MKNLEIKTHPEVELVFANYPDAVRDKMLALRELIIETASEIDEITQLEETLKWRQISYLAKNGSTLRMGWKSKKTVQYALYFQCTSKLVASFKLVFKDAFVYEGNRAIVFRVEEGIPKEELKKCIKATLTYHKVKHLPTLGIV